MSALKQKIGDLCDIITTERAFFLYLACAMIAMPVGELLSELHDFSFATQPIILEACCYSGLAMILANFLHNKNISYYPTDIFYALLIILAGLSLAFSQDLLESVTGYWYDEWFTHFIAYFSLMYAATMIHSTHYRKKLLLMFIIVALLHGTVAFFQTFGLRIDEAFYDDLWHRREKLAFGLTQHNNFYAGLTGVLVPVCAGVFLFADSKKLRNVFLAVTAFIFYGSICTEARIAWVGNICFMLFFLITFLYMRKRWGENSKFSSCMKRWGVLALVMIAVLALVVLVFGRLKGQLGVTIDELDEGEGIGTGRGYIWKMGLESVPKFWPTGIGLDNYRMAFYINPDYVEGTWTQGKGHNEYIHILVTQGAFQLVNYLSLLVYCFKVGVREVIHTTDTARRYIMWTVLAMFIGYASAACFNSSVINTAMYFWIVIGMSAPKAMQRPLGWRKSRKAAAQSDISAGGA